MTLKLYTLNKQSRSQALGGYSFTIIGASFNRSILEARIQEYELQKKKRNDLRSAGEEWEQNWNIQNPLPPEPQYVPIPEWMGEAHHSAFRRPAIDHNAQENNRYDVQKVDRKVKMRNEKAKYLSSLGADPEDIEWILYWSADAVYTYSIGQIPYLGEEWEGIYG